MTRVFWLWIFTLFLTTLTVLTANASDDAFNIGKFYEKTDSSQRMLLKVGENEKAVPVIILLEEISPARIMKIFENDVCVTAVNVGENFVGYYNCKSGAEMRVSFNCRNTCYMKGQHSQIGKWKDYFKYRINQDLTLEEILEFAGYVESNSNKETSSNQDIQKAQPTVNSASKLDKAKSICTELGFKLGTEKHGECVLKMMDN